MPEPADMPLTRSPRALRADAQQNQDRILEAAARAFAQDGSRASLKAIAKDAGVGIGTLYRRFPTREALIEATYRSESAGLAAAAADLLARHPPDVALRTWMDGFLDYMVARHGMAEVLKAVLAQHSELPASTHELLTDALAALMNAGIVAGLIRDDIDPANILQALGGIAFIAGEPDQREDADRLVGLLVDGLARRR